MAGDRQKIDPKLINQCRNLPNRLRRVGVHQHPVLPRDAADLRDGLQRPNLVIGVHDANENGLRRDGSADIGGIDHAGAIYRYIGHPHTLLFEKTTGIDNRRMLDGGGDEVIPPVPVAVCDSLEDGVVGFAAAACKNDFLCGAA
jgi:hypothetical protein